MSRDPPVSPHLSRPGQTRGPGLPVSTLLSPRQQWADIVTSDEIRDNKTTYVWLVRKLFTSSQHLRGERGPAGLQCTSCLQEDQQFYSFSSDLVSECVGLSVCPWVRVCRDLINIDGNVCFVVFTETSYFRTGFWAARLEAVPGSGECVQQAATDITWYVGPHWRTEEPCNM